MDNNVQERFEEPNIIVPAEGRWVVYGTPGIDMIDYSAKTERIHVQLAEMDGPSYTTVGGESVNMLYGVEGVIGGSGPDRLIGNSENNIFRGGPGGDGIDGGGGWDFADYSEKSGRVEAVLEEAGHTIVKVRDKTEDALLGIHNIITGSGCDLLVGDSRANWFFGNAGNDVLMGKGGPDILNGGTGGDIFRYAAVSDSTLDSFDFIADFSAEQGDEIDLSALDANSREDGKQDLVVSPQNCAASGSVWYSARREDPSDDMAVEIFADVDGDAQADFKIFLFTPDSSVDLSSILILT